MDQLASFPDLVPRIVCEIGQDFKVSSYLFPKTVFRVNIGTRMSSLAACKLRDPIQHEVWKLPVSMVSI